MWAICQLINVLNERDCSSNTVTVVGRLFMPGRKAMLGLKISVAEINVANSPRHSEF